VHTDDVGLHEDLIARLLGGEMETCSFEKRFEHADGHRTWGLMTVAPANDHSGAMQGMLIVEIQDISERKHFVGQLEFFADHDPLTSLYNQRRFRIDVDRQLAYSRRHGGNGAVLMLDLDQFKMINDQYGHAAGDAVIIAVASALKVVSRETDLVARLGDRSAHRCGGVLRAGDPSQGTGRHPDSTHGVPLHSGAVRHGRGD